MVSSIPANFISVINSTFPIGALERYCFNIYFNIDSAVSYKKLAVCCLMFAIDSASPLRNLKVYCFTFAINSVFPLKNCF